MHICMLTAKEKRTKKENCSNNNIIIKKTESKSKGGTGWFPKKQIRRLGSERGDHFLFFRKHRKIPDKS